MINSSPCLHLTDMRIHRSTVNWNAGTERKKSSNMNQTFRPSKKWPNPSTPTCLPWHAYYVNANSSRNQIWNAIKLYLNFTKYNTFIHASKCPYVVAQTRGGGGARGGSENCCWEGQRAMDISVSTLLNKDYYFYFIFGHDLE